MAYQVAKDHEVVCGFSQGFLDSIDDVEVMAKRMGELIEKAKSNGKIIIIAHPKENTIKFLKKALPSLKKKVEFITIKDYFEL